MKKKILLVAAVLVVLVLVVIIAAIINLDRLVKTGVKTGGGVVLGVPTTLDNASVSLLGGSIGLDGLVLGSLEQFDAPEMFRLGHLYADVDVWSLRGEEIVVREVVVDGPEITLEFAGTKTNWGALMEQLKGEPSEEETKSEKKVRIDRIVISNAKIKIAGIPLADTAGIPLPTLEITDLRSADGTGVTIRKVLINVIGSLHKSMLNAVKGVLPAEEIEKLSNELRSVLGDAGGMLEEAGTAADGVVKDAAEKAKGVLEGVFGGGKKEDE